MQRCYYTTHLVTTADGKRKFKMKRIKQHSRDEYPYLSRGLGLGHISNVSKAKLPETEQRVANADAQQACMQGTPPSVRRAAEQVALENGNVPLLSSKEPPKDTAHAGVQMANQSSSEHQVSSTLGPTWQAQIPTLTDAYLQFKDRIFPDSRDATPMFIEVIGVAGRENARALNKYASTTYLNESLIYHGLLGTGATYSSRAFPLRTLEIYRCCQKQCPEMGIEQWVRALCDIHNITYTLSLRNGFSNAFDAYMEIMRQVQFRTDEKLAKQQDDQSGLNPSILDAPDGPDKCCDAYHEKAADQLTLMKRKHSSAQNDECATENNVDSPAKKHKLEEKTRSSGGDNLKDRQHAGEKENNSTANVNVKRPGFSETVGRQLSHLNTNTLR